MPRLLLLIPSTSYRVSDFLAAAHRLGVEVTVGSNERQVLEELSDGGTVMINFYEPEIAVGEIEEFHQRFPLNAVIAVDDVTSTIAVRASDQLGFRHNDPAAVHATGNKLLLREALSQADLASPKYRSLALDVDPASVAAEMDYPCVLKPLNLSASQGVIRANNQDEFVTAFERIKSLVKDIGEKVPQKVSTEILIEDYIDGEEVALEGLMVDGKLTTLALFDKPDPLEGPYFEETIYITPSRKSAEIQASIKNMTEQSANAIGLKEGPIHAELRVKPNAKNTNEAGPWIIEMAARSIGGLCSRSLQFAGNLTLEDIILRHAMGEPILPEREEKASGVMMIPIPKAGILERVDGTLDAQSVPGITELTISIATGQPVRPLPEGNKYLGFIFAKAEAPGEVEAALRAAHAKLEFIIS
jgi:biotin carboxylase